MSTVRVGPRAASPRVAHPRPAHPTAIRRRRRITVWSRRSHTHPRHCRHAPLRTLVAYTRPNGDRCGAFGFVARRALGQFRGPKLTLGVGLRAAQIELRVGTGRPGGGEGDVGARRPATPADAELGPLHGAFRLHCNIRLGDGGVTGRDHNTGTQERNAERHSGNQGKAPSNGTAGQTDSGRHVFTPGERLRDGDAAALRVWILIDIWQRCRNRAIGQWYNTNPATIALIVAGQTDEERFELSRRLRAHTLSRRAP